MLPLIVGGAITVYLFYQVVGAIYNIWFHPLAAFAGPKLWIAFPSLRYVAQARGIFDQQMVELHKQYGEVVRFDHETLSFTTAQAWNDIYGYGHGKNQWPKQEWKPPGAPDNIIFSGDTEHNKLRKALTPAFSEQALRLQEGLIKSYVDMLIAALHEEAKESRDVDMTMWYNLTTFDIISDLAFGEPSNCLMNKQYNEFVANIFRFIQNVPIVQLARQYPAMWMTIQVVFGRAIIRARNKLFGYSRQAAMKRKNDRSKDGRGDFLECLLRHNDSKPEDSISDDELTSNANILFMAGSETTATLLAGATYWMLHTPGVMEKATKEVRQAFAREEDISFSTTSAGIPYMLACLEEALRMYPPVPTVLIRTMTENANVSGYTLPKGTNVGVHQLATNMSDRNFHQADSFVPERWYPSEASNEKSDYYNDNRDARQPFQVGPRNCIGKNLAFSEMRQILARVLWNFDLELVDKNKAWADQKVYVLWEKDPLLVHIKPRTD